MRSPLAVTVLLLGVSMAQADDLPDLDALWDFADPARTERVFRELLPRAEAAGDPRYRDQLLTQLARTLGLQGRFDEAHTVLDLVEARLATADARTRLRYLLERGRVLNSSGKPDEARLRFEEAWRIGREAGLDGLAVDAAHMVAIAAPAPGDKLAWNEQALALAEASEDPAARRWQGSLLNNIGWTHAEAGDWAQALPLFERAAAFHRAAAGEKRLTDTRGWRIARWTVARALRQLGRLDEALTIQRELLQAWHTAGGEDGFVYEELGECLLAQGDEAAAREWFRKASPLLEAMGWVGQSDPERLRRLKRLAGLTE